MNLVRTKDVLTSDEIDNFYQTFNPGIIDALSDNGVFFTPYDLAFDLALMSSRSGHIVDACGGIGMLSYAMLCRDRYEDNIKSITIIELNPDFIEIGKKLIPDPRVRWICSNVFDQNLWNDLVKDLDDNRFDVMISNPPFGRMKIDSPWLSYVGNRDLMVLQLCLNYSKNGYFVLPSMSSPFKFSGERFYQEFQSRELQKFIKANDGILWNGTCDGIDCHVYREDWKNLSGINVECVSVGIYPWSLDSKEDAINFRVDKT